MGYENGELPDQIQLDALNNSPLGENQPTNPLQARWLNALRVPIKEQLFLLTQRDPFYTTLDLIRLVDPQGRFYKPFMWEQRSERPEDQAHGSRENLTTFLEEETHIVSRQQRARLINLLRGSGSNEGAILAERLVELEERDETMMQRLIDQYPNLYHTSMAVFLSKAALLAPIDNGLKLMAGINGLIAADEGINRRVNLFDLFNQRNRDAYALIPILNRALRVFKIRGTPSDDPYQVISPGAIESKSKDAFALMQMSTIEMAERPSIDAIVLIMGVFGLFDKGIQAAGLIFNKVLQHHINRRSREHDFADEFRESSNHVQDLGIEGAQNSHRNVQPEVIEISDRLIQSTHIHNEAFNKVTSMIPWMAELLTRFAGLILNVDSTLLQLYLGGESTAKSQARNTRTISIGNARGSLEHFQEAFERLLEGLEQKEAQLCQTPEGIAQNPAEAFKRNVSYDPATGKIHLCCYVDRAGTLKNADLELEGNFVKLEGPNASGKSSLIDYLLRAADVAGYQAEVGSTEAGAARGHLEPQPVRIANIILTDPNHSFWEYYTSTIGSSADEARESLQIWIAGYYDTVPAKDIRLTDEFRRIDYIMKRFISHKFEETMPNDGISFTDQSEGQKGLMELATVLMNERADLIIIDEVFSHIDLLHTTQLVTMLAKQWQSKEGRRPSVIVVAHDSKVERALKASGLSNQELKRIVMGNGEIKLQS